METPATEVKDELSGGSSFWPTFFSRSKKEFRFICFEAPDMLRVNQDIVKGGEHSEYFWNMRVSDVDVDNLKFLGVWDQLPNEMQEKLIKGDIDGENEAKTRMDHARQHRRNKYPDIPREVKCNNCGVVQKMAPGNIAARIDKLASERGIYLLDDFLKDFQCQKCRPTKGRRAKHNLPPKIELVCSCGNRVSYPASIVSKTLEKKGITLEQYQSGYKCRTCKPFRGRQKDHNLPPKVELKCRCGKSVIYPASVALKFAEKKGLTVEKFIEGYACQSCKPSPRGRKSKSK